jgi:alpha/beta superfamily hydrolase
MPEVNISGPSGRLEGRFHPQKNANAPVAIILHPHPKFGGTMNNRVVYNLHYCFFNLGFSCLRFNFRSVGKSEGEFDDGLGELADAASALDFLQANSPSSSGCWVVGFSFGSWIGMQLLMRRPEISGFISVSPPANTYDFSFLAPCPSSGLIINGSLDRLVPPSDIKNLSDRLKLQKGIKVSHKEVEGADHFFTNFEEEMTKAVNEYLTTRSDL